MLASWPSLLDQLQNEHHSSEMPLVETELTSSLAFRSVIGKCSRMRTLGKVRQAGCGPCGLCCVRVRACACARIRARLSQGQEQQGCLPLSGAMGAHSGIGRTIQNKDYGLSVFQKSCCVFRKHSPSPVTFLHYSLRDADSYCSWREGPVAESRLGPLRAPGAAPWTTFSPPPAHRPPLWGWSRAWGNHKADGTEGHAWSNTPLKAGSH